MKPNKAPVKPLIYYKVEFNLDLEPLLKQAFI